jgi:excisionase family DNA binding protein
VSDVVEPLLVPIKEAARLLNCCRETVYHMEKRGQIRLVRAFKRTMVPLPSSTASSGASSARAPW